MRHPRAVLATLLTLGAPPVWGADSSKPKKLTQDRQSSISQVEVVCPTQSERARTLYNQGTELETQGKIEEAVASYQKAIEADPKYCDAMDNLGLVFRRAGQLDQAIGWYKRSIAVAPGDGAARTNLAAAYRMNHQSAEAVVEYTALVKLLPKDAEGHYGLGSLYTDLGRFREAIDPLKEAEKIYLAQSSPYVADARTALGRAYLGLGEWALAAATLQQNYATHGEDPELNLELGTALAKQKKNEPAARYLRKAREGGLTVPPELAAQVGL